MAVDITQAVRDAFEQWSTAWNNGDLEGYLAGYHDADDIRWVRDTRIVRGKTDIAAMYRSSFSTPEQMGHLALTHLEVTPVGDADAVVFGTIEYTVNDQRSTAAFTAHLRKIDGAWLILSDHTAG